MKTLFVFNVDSAVDIITNSSSELFIFEGQNIDLVEEMIKNVYPDYEDEYSTVRSVSDISGSNYMVADILSRYVIHRRIQKAEEICREVGIKLEEMIPCREYFDSYGDIRIPYEKSAEIIKKYIKPLNLYYIVSHEDNPDPDWQDSLEMIGSRIHLG